MSTSWGLERERNLDLEWSKFAQGISAANAGQEWFLAGDWNGP